VIVIIMRQFLGEWICRQDAGNIRLHTSYYGGQALFGFIPLVQIGVIRV
jgi:hypothetical protein